MGSVLFPIGVLDGVVFKEGGLGDFLKVVCEVVDVVFFGLDDLNVVLLLVHGTIPESIEHLDDGCFSVGDEFYYFFEHLVLVADQFFAVGGQVGLELVYPVLVLFSLGQDLAHYLPVFVHFIFEFFLVGQDQLGLKVDDWVAALFLELPILFLDFPVDLDQHISFIFNLIAQFLVFLDLAHQSGSYFQVGVVAVLQNLQTTHLVACLFFEDPHELPNKHLQFLYELESLSRPFCLNRLMLQR